MNRFSFILFGALALGVSNSSLAGGNCPDLDVKNIGDAACSTPTSPFLTAPLASVRFSATTPCPSGIWKKKLQAIFKGNKTYPPTESNLKSGAVTCTYELNKDWQGVLGTSATQLVLEASLPSRDHANFWSAPTFGPRCPDLEQGDLESIKSGKIVVERKRTADMGGNLTYEFVTKGLDRSTGGKIVGAFKSLPKGAKLKNGKAELAQAFEVQCNYTYHPDGTETKIELNGVQQKK